MDSGVVQRSNLYHKNIWVIYTTDKGGKSQKAAKSSLELVFTIVCLFVSLACRHIFAVGKLLFPKQFGIVMSWSPLVLDCPSKHYFYILHFGCFKTAPFLS